MLCDEMKAIELNRLMVRLKPHIPTCIITEADQLHAIFSMLTSSDAPTLISLIANQSYILKHHILRISTIQSLICQHSFQRPDTLPLLTAPIELSAQAHSLRHHLAASS